VRELFHENGILRGQLITTKDCLKAAEAELERSQEKVSQLQHEVDKNEKNAAYTAIDIENMRLVRKVGRHVGFCAMSLRGNKFGVFVYTYTTEKFRR